jgi:hypothetical protein
MSTPISYAGRTIEVYKDGFDGATPWPWVYTIDGKSVSVCYGKKQIHRIFSPTRRMATVSAIYLINILNGGVDWLGAAPEFNLEEAAKSGRQ